MLLRIQFTGRIAECQGRQMTRKPDTNTSQTGSPDVQTNEPAGEALASDALARRRLLLKSLGKGSSVILAAAVPMHTLAAPSTRSLAIVDVTSVGSTGEKAKRCSVSGFQSMAHSKVSTQNVCWGKGLNNYKTGSWPTGSCDSVSVTKTTAFNKIFTSSSSTASLLDEIKAGGTNGHWVTALLNSLLPVGTTNFPYTAAQVKAFYLADPTVNSKAYIFFTGYMETR